MAQNLTVKPAYLNNTQVMIDGVLTLLTNNLTQAQLLAIWQKPEYNSFIAIEYVNVQDSFPESFQIDPNLFNAYDSGQISHDKTKTNYPVNTMGQHLNETRGVADATKNGLVSSATLPTKILDFAASKMLPSDCIFTRASVASYVDKYGTIKYAGVNQPRFTHDPLTLQSLGILIEEERTNLYPNSAYISTTVGGNGSAIQQFGGISHSVTDYSIQKGLDVVTIRASGVAININNLLLAPMGALTSVSVGKRYTLSFWINTNLKAASLAVAYMRADQSIISQATFDTTNIINNSILERKVFVLGEATPTDCASLRIWISFGGATVGSSYDFTFQYAAPQLEEGQSATSYIRTTTVAVTRNADVLYLSNSVVPKIEGAFVLTGVSAGTWEKTQGTYRRIMSASNMDLIAINGPTSNINSWDGSTSLISGTSTLYDNIVLAYNQSLRKFSANGLNVTTGQFISSIMSGSLYIGSQLGVSNFINGTIKRLTIYSKMLPDAELIALSTKGRVSGFESASQVANSGLGEAAFLDVKSLMFAKNRQEFSIDGTGVAITRNIRRPYDFMFELVDTTGYTALTSQPPAMPTLCSANTDYPLTVTLPVGKTLTYCVYPVVY